MERTKNPVNLGTNVIWWKKIGGGSFRPTTGRLKGKIIKSGQKFKASVDDIPEAFRDTIIPLQEIPSSTKTPAPEVKGDKSVYTIQARGKGGWYDVVDANGKVLNEKALKKEIAEKLVKDLAK